jgi:hypothetical protein
MKNIVEFPSHRIVRENINAEIIELAKEKSTQKFADTITEDIVGNIIEDLENSGVDVERTEFIKDFSLAADALRAAVYRQFGIDHSLHEFIDKNIKMVNRLTGEPLEIIEDVLDSE